MYVANQSFIASNGKTYRMGEPIDSKTYDSFTKLDRAKCTKKRDEGDRSLKHPSPGLGDMLGTGVPGGIDEDENTPW